jgi:hypothetical protein
LKPGDPITAGHLTIVYSPEGDKPSAPKPGVVVFEGESGQDTTSASITLEGALSKQTMVLERGGAKASAPLQALIKAGMELSENQPLADLFQTILSQAIQAVNAQRGVVMILENGELVAKAHKGEGFRISTAVRDQVLNDKTSIRVQNAQLDEAFKSRRALWNSGSTP